MPTVHPSYLVACKLRHLAPRNAGRRTTHRDQRKATSGRQPPAQLIYALYGCALGRGGTTTRWTRTAPRLAPGLLPLTEQPARFLSLRWGRRRCGLAWPNALIWVNPIGHGLSTVRH